MTKKAKPASTDKTAETVSIYVLRHPVTGETRYVGKAKCVKARLSGHMRDAQRKKAPVSMWIKSLFAEGLKPTVEVIETCAHSEWEAREKHWISELRKDGRLLNIADGGLAPYCSPEVRRQNARKTLSTLCLPFRKIMCEIGAHATFAKRHNLPRMQAVCEKGMALLRAIKVEKRAEFAELFWSRHVIR